MTPRDHKSEDGNAIQSVSISGATYKGVPTNDCLLSVDGSISKSSSPVSLIARDALAFGLKS